MASMMSDPRFPVSHPGGRCQAMTFVSEAGIWDRCDRSAEPGNVFCDECRSVINAAHDLAARAPAGSAHGAPDWRE